MKRLLIGLSMLLVGAALVPAATAASAPTLVSGGGTGTFGADLDGDGDIDGSHFGLGVAFDDGSPRGHFECLMSGGQDFLGLHLMAVEGRVTGGSANVAAGTAVLTGSGTLHIDDEKVEVTFVVTVLQEGGPGVGRFQLDVFGTGGAVIAAFPPETLATGRISVH